MNDYDLDIFRLASSGYCCSQIIVKMALKIQGVDNPGLVRAMAGLCNGFPSMEGPCGALGGAACLLAYIAGKGEDSGEENERLPLMMSQLTDWFSEYAQTRFSGQRCKDIVQAGELDPVICGALVGDCYGAAITILTENGFDLEEMNG